MASFLIDKQRPVNQAPRTYRARTFVSQSGTIPFFKGQLATLHNAKAHAENGSICSFWTDPHYKQTVLRRWTQCYLYCIPVLSIKMTSQMMNVVVISPQCCSSGRRGDRCEAPQRPSSPHLLHHSVSVWKERGWEEMYSFLPNLYGGQDVSSGLWFWNDPVPNDSAVFLELSLKPSAAFSFHLMPGYIINK